MNQFNMADLKKRMNGALEVLRKEFAGLRTGRASASLLEPISVPAYSELPLNQVSTVSVPEARMLSVQVWDKGLVKAVEKAIRTADLGLNPSVEGNLIRVPIPELSQQRREELVKVAARTPRRPGGGAQRRDGMEQLKKLEKDGALSQDEQHKTALQVQELTDAEIKQINEMLAAKEAEIMTI